MQPSIRAHKQDGMSKSALKVSSFNSADTEKTAGYKMYSLAGRSFDLPVHPRNVIEILIPFMTPGRGRGMFY